MPENISQLLKATTSNTIGRMPRLRVRVTTAAEKIVRSGHPWLFVESIRELNREGVLGEIGVVYDQKDRFLALGLFDPHSPIRLRVLLTGKPQTIDSGWWAARLEKSLARRRDLFDAQTTGYRWIHGESDGWPGLVLDRYDSTLVLKLYTAAWLPRLEELVMLIKERLRPDRLVLRLSRNIQAIALETLNIREGEVLIGGQPDSAIVFMEAGLQFEADVLKGQKTGFFLDQRENRRRVETLVKGCEVLNAFSFSGAFSLYAARGGAGSVTDLDISGHALASAERNFVLNRSIRGVSRCQHELIQADAFEWLSQNSHRKFDLIILDPPALAKRQAERAAALQAYRQLAVSGAAHLRPGGVLVACSCSAHIGADEFFQVVRNSVLKTGRRFEEIDTTRHPTDHPAAFKEAEYLKTIYLRLTADRRRV